MSEIVLSHYRLLDRIGAGGMGEVYKAQDTQLDRLVAIKLLPAAAVADPDRVQRFRKEAKATSALNHPSIMTIHEVGESGGQHYITMEFIDGETLRQRLARGPMELRLALDVAAQAAEGLAAAHAAGIVHRDIKPENIMVRRDGFTKILDFGLAKLTEALPGGATSLSGPAGAETILQSRGPRDGSRDGESNPTLPGMVLGTVAYMSPEQVRGETLDPRSDLFSFGSVLYEMVTGRQPFLGPSSIEVMHQILKETPRPLHELSPQAPVELQRILRKAMAKDREERYQSGKDLAIDLKQLKREIESGSVSAAWPGLAGSAPAAPQPASAAAHRPLAIGLGLLVLLAAAAGLYFARGRHTSGPIAQLQVTKLTASGHARSPALSPDRKVVVYVTSEGGKNSIWVKQLATSTTTQLLPPVDESLQELSFSPDGNWVYYLSTPQNSFSTSLYRAAVVGGAPRKLFDRVDGQASFSPDGKQIVFERHERPNDLALWRASADGSGEPQLLFKDPAGWVAEPRWSPDGTQLAVVHVDKKAQTVQRVGLMPAAGGLPKPVGTMTWMTISGLCWAPDASGLYVTGTQQFGGTGQLWYLEIASGTPRQITSDLNSYSGVSVSADGRSLVATRGLTDSNFWKVPAGGSPAENTHGAVQITSGTARVQLPAISPDGTQVAYFTDATGNSDIWVMNLDGTNARQLTIDTSDDLMPAWSPDGRRIAFTSNRIGGFQLWVMNADGSNQKQLTQGAIHSYPSWSPDGQWLACHVAREGGAYTSKVPAAGGEAVQLVQSISFLPSWSPDGHSILSWIVPDSPPGPPRLALVSPAGGAPRFLDIAFSGNNAYARWSPSGQLVTTCVSQGGNSNLVEQSVDGGPPHPLTEFTDRQRLYSFYWTRDGKTILCERGTTTQDIVLLDNPR